MHEDAMKFMVGYTEEDPHDHTGYPLALRSPLSIYYTPQQLRDGFTHGDFQHPFLPRGTASQSITVLREQTPQTRR